MMLDIMLPHGIHGIRCTILIMPVKNNTEVNAWCNKVQKLTNVLISKDYFRISLGRDKNKWGK